VILTPCSGDIAPNSQLVEIEGLSPDYNNPYLNNISTAQTDYVCIDDLVPPVGYSFLFMQNENLYHGFSYRTYH
jgi:hypothetical protein